MKIILCYLSIAGLRFMFLCPQEMLGAIPFTRIMWADLFESMLWPLFAAIWLMSPRSGHR